MILKSINDPKLPELLNNGGVGVLTTDTLYGLVCVATNQEATDKLYKLKRRENKPGTLIAANIDQLSDLGLKHRYVKAVEQFWPGPLSIIIPSGPELHYLHRGMNGLACRVVSGPPELLNLLSKTGALLTTSANMPGEPEAHNIEEAKKYFGDKVNFYVDGGDLSDRAPSTVIRVVDDAVEVLRMGAVKIDETGRITP